jgi:hypothetical protein
VIAFGEPGNGRTHTYNDACSLMSHDQWQLEVWHLTIDNVHIGVA